MATHVDAELILKLYDLRRESVCRQARSWFAGWKPVDADAVKAVLSGQQAQENAYLRQSTSYWEMAFSLVNQGCIDETLFAKNCGEGLLFAVKCQHLGQQFGEAFTRRMAEAEAFMARNPVAAEKAALFRKRFA